MATGFPSGLYPIETRLKEIEYATKMGATEIDVVLDRSLVLSGEWNILYEEVKQMRLACGDAHLKVILGVGELGTLENVRILRYLGTSMNKVHSLTHTFESILVILDQC